MKWEWGASTQSTSSTSSLSRSESRMINLSTNKEVSSPTLRKSSCSTLALGKQLLKKASLRIQGCSFKVLWMGSMCASSPMDRQAPERPTRCQEKENKKKS